MTILEQSVENKPLWLLAELTYKCPLACAYCSNPLDFNSIKDSLSKDQWIDILRQARQLGSVQLGFSGGEPMLRSDLPDLVSEASSLGYYSNLITSGIGLTKEKLYLLKDKGLNHIQISFQGASETDSKKISLKKTFHKKFQIAKSIKEAGYPLVMNVVIHRYNIDHIEEIINLANEISADYLELANVQFEGFAWINKHLLLPTNHQIKTALKKVEAFRKSENTMKVFFIVPDFLESSPKKCCNGWGNILMVITPDGTVLPCHGARKIKSLKMPNIESQSLKEIWQSSDLFQSFRGTEWMKEPCKTCPNKDIDLGGCRCQALTITGDLYAADPVCPKSPHHHLVKSIVSNADKISDNIELIYRK